MGDVDKTGGNILFTKRKLKAPIIKLIKIAEGQYAPANILATPIIRANNIAIIPDFWCMNNKASAIDVKIAICSDNKPLIDACDIIGEIFNVSNGGGK